MFSSITMQSEIKWDAVLRYVGLGLALCGLLAVSTPPANANDFPPLGAEFDRFPPASSDRFSNPADRRDLGAGFDWRMGVDSWRNELPDRDERRFGPWRPGSESLGRGGFDRGEWERTFEREWGREFEGRFDGRLENDPVDRFPSRDWRLRDTAPDSELKPQAAPATLIDHQRERLARLKHRYQDPNLIRFVRGLTYARAEQLFREVQQIIDTRHLSPVSYAKRAEYALGNLEHALSDPNFVRAAGLRSSPDPRQVTQQLAQLKASASQVRDVSSAISHMRSTMGLLANQMGLHQSFVALEYIYGSAEVLDRYSSLELDKNAGGPSASLDDHVVGIGVEIRVHDDGAEIVRVLRNGPAARSQLQAGDIITMLDGQPMTGRSIAQIADAIAGPAGTALQMQFRREELAYRVTLRRARVELLSVSEARIVDEREGVGYIRLEKFAASSEREVDQALWSLHQQGMKSLVFDLRGNPGGLLTAAIALSDKFLPCGSIVSTRGRLSSDNSAANADHSQTWKVPLVVLIDGDSASASEIFAAAIQENERGLVVGQRSYGKGTVQTHFPLKSVAGTLRLTTAKFYSPKGRAMAGEGVVPDILVRRYDERDAVDQERAELARAIQLASSAEVAQAAEHGGQCRPTNSDMLLGSTNR